SARQKTLSPGTRDTQPDGAEAGHEIPLVVAVAVLPALPGSPFIPSPARETVALPLRLQLEKSLPGQSRLPVQIAPKRLLEVCQEMLEVFVDRCYFRHRAEGSFFSRYVFSFFGQTQLTHFALLHDLACNT